MNSLESQSFLSLDTETTGIDVFKERVVSVGVASGSRKEITHLEELLFQVDIEIPEGASRVHGITTEKANNEGLPREQLSVISSLIQRDCVEGSSLLVVYNAPFDLTLLRCEFDRLQIDQPEWAKVRVVDPHVLDKSLDKYRKGSRTLSNTFKHYLGEELKGAHGALDDSIASIRVLFEILDKYGDSKLSNERTLRELMGTPELNVLQSIIFAEQTRSLKEYYQRSGKKSASTFDGSWPFKSGVTT